MVIRKYWRHLCLTFAAFFWSSCGDDGNSVTPPVNPDVLPDDGSSVLPPEASVESSSSLDSALNEISSSSVNPVRDPNVITLYSDPTKTCTEKMYAYMSPAFAPRIQGSCETYLVLMQKDTTYAPEELREIEDGLESCDDPLCQEPVALYGVPSVGGGGYVTYRPKYVTDYNCSDGRVYQRRDDSLIPTGFPRAENNILFLNEMEYNAALAEGLLSAPKYEPEPMSSASIETEPESSSATEVESSSSETTVESSSSEETLESSSSTEGDKFMDFVRVDDIYRAVSDSLEAKIVKDLNDESISLERKRFLLSCLSDDDRLNEKFTEVRFDYYDENSNSNLCTLKGSLENGVWFSGFVAKHQKLSDGTIEETERYKEKLKAIYDILEKRIESHYKPTEQ